MKRGSVVVCKRDYKKGKQVIARVRRMLNSALYEEHVDAIQAGIRYIMSGGVANVAKVGKLFTMFDLRYHEETPVFVVLGTPNQMGYDMLQRMYSNHLGRYWLCADVATMFRRFYPGVQS